MYKNISSDAQLPQRSCRFDSSSTPKSQRWPPDKEAYTSRFTMGQPSRTGRPVSPKPVVGDLVVCVLDEAQPLI
ncbi:hypothetical protein MRX96_014694 [Rhipicephalus microplus]